MYHGHTTVLLKVIASIQRCSTCRGPLWYVLLLLLSYALFFWLCGLPTRHSWDCVLNQAVFLTSVVRLCSCFNKFFSRMKIDIS